MSFSDDEDDPTRSALDGDVDQSGFDDVDHHGLTRNEGSSSAFLQEAEDYEPGLRQSSSPPPFASHKGLSAYSDEETDAAPKVRAKVTHTTAAQTTSQASKSAPVQSAKKRSMEDNSEGYAAPAHTTSQSTKKDSRSARAAPLAENGQYPTSSKAKQPLQTRVLEPRVVGAGGDKHVEYQVETLIEPALAQVAFEGHTKFSVFRRFSDFTWLRETLDQRYPGFIIPPLPDKTLPLVQDNLAERFYMSRARSLDYFLSHVAAHVVLSRDVAVKDFLIAEQSRFEQVRKPSLSTETSAPAAMQVVSTATAGIFEKVLDWGQTLGTTLNSTISGAARVGAQRRNKDASDERFEEAQKYINELEPKVRLVYEGAKQLVDKNQTLSKSLHELGLAFTQMGQSEQQPQLSEAITSLGNVCNGSSGLSILVNGQVQSEQVRFVEPIEDYVRLVGAAKQALNVRTKMALAYEYALGEFTLKRAAREKMAPNDARIPTAEDEIRDAEQRLESAKTDFEMVTDRVLKEIERFKREKSADFKALIQQYVQMQIEHNQAVELLWRSVLPKFHQVRPAGGAGGRPDEAGDDV